MSDELTNPFVRHFEYGIGLFYHHVISHELMDMKPEETRYWVVEAINRIWMRARRDLHQSDWEREYKEYMDRCAECDTRFVPRLHPEPPPDIFTRPVPEPAYTGVQIQPDGICITIMFGGVLKASNISSAA